MTKFTANMIRKIKQQFPASMPVIVAGASKTGRGTFATSEVIGTIVDWRHESTGASYSQNGDSCTPNADGKLQLLRLQKVDGEMTDLVIDDLTTMAKVEAL